MQSSRSWYGWFTRCASLLIALCLAEPVQASGLSAGIDAQFAVLEDHDASLSPAQVLAGAYHDDFVPVHDARVSAKQAGTALWLRIELPASANVSTTRLLVLGPPYVDELVFYNTEPQFKHGRVRISSGDAVPFAEKPFASRLHAFKLPDSAGTYYLRATSEGILNLNWELTTERDFVASERLVGTAYAILLGVLATMILFNLGIFLAIGDQTYIYYVLYHICAAFLIYSMAGYSSQYLWPYLGNSTNRSIPLSLIGMCFFGVLFMRSFLDLKRLLPGYSRLLAGAAVVVLLLAVPGLLLPYTQGANFVFTGALVVLVAMSIALFAARANNVTTARYLVITFIFAVLPGSLGAFGYAFGVLPENVFASHALEITTVSETLLLSLFMAYRIKLSEQEKLEAQQRNIELHRSFNERMLSKQEEERSRIARELHDSVAPNLSALKMHLQSIEDGGRGGPMLSTAQTLDLLQSTIDEVRHLSHNLHPRQLDDVSLSNALVMYTRQFRGSAVPDFRFQMTGDEPTIAEDVKIHLYRIAQEAIQNVVTHAQASHCLVSLESDGNRLTLSIRDNGCGFDRYENGRSGLGMTSMDDRANIIEAELDIDSAPGEGTRITVKLNTGTRPWPAPQS